MMAVGRAVESRHGLALLEWAVDRLSEGSDFLLSNENKRPLFFCLNVSSWDGAGEKVCEALFKVT